MIHFEEKLVIQKCIQGELKYQKLLFDKYSSIFYYICLRYCKDKDEANDLLQDSFIKIFNNLSKFKFEGSFEGWMKRIVINTSIENFRRKKEFSSLDNISVSEGPITIDYDYIDEKILLQFIQELPIGFRTVFNMYVIEGYSHKEISEKLNIAEGTSKSQLSRARNLLKQKINKHFD